MSHQFDRLFGYVIGSLELEGHVAYEVTLSVLDFHTKWRMLAQPIPLLQNHMNRLQSFRRARGSLSYPTAEPAVGEQFARRPVRQSVFAAQRTEEPVCGGPAENLV